MRWDDGNFGEWAAQFYDGWMSAAGEELAATVAASAGVPPDAVRRRWPTR